MIGFKKFLVEKWGRGSPYATQPSHADEYKANHKFRKEDRKNNLHHHGKVDGHDVHTYFCKDNSGHHDVHFTINHNDRKQEGVKIDHRKVLKHIHGVINNFVKRTKPKRLNFIANSDKKQKFYGEYAKVLAKKTGGKAKHIAGLFHAVEYKHESR